MSYYSNSNFKIVLLKHSLDNTTNTPQNLPPNSAPVEPSEVGEHVSNRKSKQRPNGKNIFTVSKQFD